MANNTTSNPKIIDTQGAADVVTNESVRLIQWVDDNGDLVHDSNLIMKINGVTTVEATIQPVNDQLGFGAVAWQIGPFNPGINMSIAVTTLSAGNVHIWVT